MGEVGGKGAGGTGTAAGAPDVGVTIDGVPGVAGGVAGIGVEVGGFQVGRDEAGADRPERGRGVWIGSPGAVGFGGSTGDEGAAVDPVGARLGTGDCDRA